MGIAGRALVWCLARICCLSTSSQEKADVVKEGEESACMDSSPLASPAYGELLDLMALATARLDLAWGC